MTEDQRSYADLVWAAYERRFQMHERALWIYVAELERLRDIIDIQLQGRILDRERLRKAGYPDGR